MGNRLFLYSIYILVLAGCSGITPISQHPPEEIKTEYGEDFLKQMEGVKLEFAKGHHLQSLELLAKVLDKDLSSQEKALKYNLQGVILFSNGKFSEASKSLETAEGFAHADEELRNHIRLNRSGTAFKLENFPQALNFWQTIDQNFLPVQEKSKYFQLAQLLGEKLTRKDLVLLGMAFKIQNYKISEMENRAEGKQLLEIFDQLSYGEKMRVLASQDAKPLPTPFGFLGLTELNRARNEGRVEDQGRIEKWLKDNFEDDPDLAALFIPDDQGEAVAFNPHAIGVVLPFTADKKAFADKSLEGINFAFKEVYPSKAEEEVGVGAELFIEDNQDNPVGAAFAVRKLAQKNNVAFIIGGLFPEEAIAEYREAKKHHVHFVSLSPVYLPAKEKDEYLIEVAGPLESQLVALKESGLLERVGKKIGIFFPNDSKGRYSAQAIWEQAMELGMEVRRVQSFNKDEVDFRVPVQKFLGNYYKRARQEEVDIWKNINFYRKDSGRKKYSEIPPVVDFDWVFIPAFPQQVEVIIPLFSYFDADSLNYFGDPSWFSAKLARKNSRLGPLYFSGPQLGDAHKLFVEKFQREYGKTPKLIESLSYEGMKTMAGLLRAGRNSERDEFAEYLKSRPQLQGVTGDYYFAKGHWSKKLGTFKILRDQVTQETTQEGQNPLVDEEVKKF